MLCFELEKESVWVQLKKTREPIVMYGTGNGADKVFDALNEYGIEISGVTASDGFVRKRQFHGFEVRPLKSFEEMYDSFTVIVTFGTQIPEVMKNIRDIAQRHTVLVPCVPVTGSEIFNEEFIKTHEDEINRAFSLMADERSKRVFADYVNFEFSGKLRFLFDSETDENEAFENCIPLSQNEVYADIGAYRGDTVEKFLVRTGAKYKMILAAEPDKKSFNKLCENCKNLKNFKAVNKAVTGYDGTAGFSALAGRQSAIGGDTPTECVTLATLCGEHIPTFIKIDAEGCEAEILAGGADILKNHRPALQVAAYHKTADIFELALLINSIQPQYRIYLRHHPYIPAWDTNLYCE